MAAAGSISGVVRDLDGAPVTGATVHAYDAIGRSRIGTTGEDGAYVVEPLVEGWHRAQVRPAPPFLPAFAGDTYSYCGSDSVRVADEDVGGVDFVVPVGGSLSGVVTDAAGAPIEGASVRAAGLEFYNEELARTDVTDADGRYSLDGLDSISIDGEPRDGLYRVSVSRGGAAWYAPGTWDLTEAEPVGASRDEERTLDLALPLQGAVTGLVFGAAGPVEGADVRVQISGDPHVHTTQTDVDGQYTVTDLDGGSATVRARRLGYALTGLPDVAHAGESVPLVPDELTTAPDLHLLQGADLRVALSIPDGGAHLSVRGEAGTLGSQSASGPGSILLTDLPPGDVTVTLVGTQPTGVASVSAPATLVSGDTTELTLTASAGVAVFGVVSGKGGRDLADATIEALDPETGAALATARSDVLGFELGPLPVIPFVLRASWTPWCEGDPAFVPRWAPAARTEDAATVFDPSEGERFDVDFVLPRDGDADGMDDVWELAWSLDPLRDDGREDPDDDGANNLAEYRADTDPRDWTPGADCASAPLLILLPLLRKRGQRR